MRIDERPWMRASFTQQRQHHIRDVFQPMGIDRDPESLLVGDPFQVAYDLGHLIGWFDNPRDPCRIRNSDARATSRNSPLARSRRVQ